MSCRGKQLLLQNGYLKKLPRLKIWHARQKCIEEGLTK